MRQGCGMTDHSQTQKKRTGRARHVVVLAKVRWLDSEYCAKSYEERTLDLVLCVTDATARNCFQKIYHQKLLAASRLITDANYAAASHQNDCTLIVELKTTFFVLKRLVLRPARLLQCISSKRLCKQEKLGDWLVPACSSIVFNLYHAVSY